MSKWEWKKLGEVCDVIAGQSPQSSAYNSEGLGLEFHQGKKAFGKRVIQPSNVWTKEYSKIAKKGDILMSVRAPVGPVNFTDREICIGRGLAAIRKTGALDENFLFYYFINNESNMTSKAGAVFDSINRSDIQKFIIPVPPLSEQKRIVKFLDEEFSKIETLKTNAETNLKNAKELFETTLEKELNPQSRHSERSEESSADLPSGWEWKTLQEICGKIVDGTHNSPPNKAKGDYQYITAKNIKADGIDLSDVTYVSKEVHKEIFARCNPEKGDVLLIKDGATTGIAVINTLDYEFSLLSSVALIKVDKTKIYEKTLVYLLNSKAIYKQMRKKMDGAAITRLTLEKIKALQIPLPPLSVQKEIVARLDKLSENVKRLEANYKQIIANCDELKKSILKKTFEGDSRSSRE